MALAPLIQGDCSGSWQPTAHHILPAMLLLPLKDQAGCPWLRPESFQLAV
jgi:hypothetical protein